MEMEPNDVQNSPVESSPVIPLEPKENKNQSQIAGAIVIAGVIIAGAIMLNGHSAPRDLTTLSKEFNACLDSGKYATAVTDSTSQGQKAGVTGTPKGFIVVDGKVISTIDGAIPYSEVKKKIDDALAGTTPGNVVAALPPVSDTDFTLGEKTAKVTVIMYEDFQCPFCGRFFRDSESNLRNTYVKNGQVLLVYRDFAFLGSESNRAGEAALCANEQGKFWEYHDYLYSHQNGENQGAFSDTNLKTFAGTLKLK